MSRVVESEAQAYRYTVHAIAFRNEELWVAQCLEVDIVGFTDLGLQELVEDLAAQLHAAALLAAVAGRTLLEDYRKAPPRWWEALSRAEGPPWRPARRLLNVDLRVYPMERVSIEGADRMPQEDGGYGK